MSGLATRSTATGRAARALCGRRHSIKKFLVVATAAALLTACGTETDLKLAELAAKVPPVPPAGVEGRVSDADTGTAIAGASLSMAAAPVETATGLVTPSPVTGTTSAIGAFSLTGVKAASNAMLHVTATNYMDAWFTVNAVPGYTTTVAVEMLPVEASASINPSVGGSVTSAPGQVTLGAGVRLVQASGTAATSPVTVRVATYDMAQELSTVPGDFTTSAGPIQTWGGFVVSATDAGGRAVDLAAGQTVTLRVPYSSRDTGTPPASLHLFHFDTTTGLWVDSGITATLGGAAPDQYYQATVGSLGNWMAARVINVATVTGCVKNEAGQPVDNVRIAVEGNDYSGISYAVTSGGQFTAKVRPGSTLIVNGQLGPYLTNTRVATAGATGSTTSIDGCLVLGSQAGAPRITLSWGLSPRDVDTHLFTPDGTEIDFTDKGSLTAAPFAALDVDDTTSYGPEVVTFRRLMVGTYTYAVHNWSGEFATSSGLTDSPVLVELRRGLSVLRFRPGPGETSSTKWWTAFTFTVASDCSMTLSTVNTFSGTRPAPASSGPATYCVEPAQ